MKQSNTKCARLREFDKDTFGLIQRLHRAICRKSPLSTFAAIRDQLVRQHQQIDTRYTLLTAVTRTVFDESSTKDVAWKRFFRAADDIESQTVKYPAKEKRRSRTTLSNETRRLRNLAVIASLWSPAVTVKYKLNLAAQRQMYMIRACATTYPNFDSFRYRWNAVRLARHCRALEGGKEKTIQEAIIQLKDFRLSDLASVEVDEVYEALWTQNQNGAIPIDDQGTYLNSIRPKHFHLYLLEKDDRGVLVPRTAFNSGRDSRDNAAPDNLNNTTSSSSSTSLALVLSPSSEPSSASRGVDISSPITPLTSAGSPPSLEHSSIVNQRDQVASTSMRCAIFAESPPLVLPPSPHFYLPVSEPSLHCKLYRNEEHWEWQLAGDDIEFPPAQTSLQFESSAMDENTYNVGHGLLHQASLSSPQRTSNIAIGQEHRLQPNPPQDVSWDYIWSSSANQFRLLQASGGNETGIHCYSLADFENIVRNSAVLPGPVLVREEFTDGQRHNIENFLLNLQDVLGSDPINDASIDNSTASAFSPREISTMWKEHSHSGLSFINLPELSNAHRPSFTMLKRFRLLELLVQRTKRGSNSSEAPCSLDTLTTNELAFEGAVLEARHTACGGSWFRCLEGASLWKLTFEDAEPTRKGQCLSKFVVLEENNVLLIPPGCNITYTYYAPQSCLLSKGSFWDELCLLPMLRSATSNTDGTGNENWYPRKCTCNAVLKALEDLICDQPARFSAKLPPETWQLEFHKAMADLNTSRRTCLLDRRFLRELSDA